MRTRVSTNGRILLPAALRRRDDVQAGDEFSIVRIRPGEYRLSRVERRRNEGLVDLLLDCPERDWFTPIPDPGRQ